MHVGQFGRTGSGGFDASSSIWEHRGSWAPEMSRPALEVITELMRKPMLIVLSTDFLRCSFHLSLPWLALIGSKHSFVILLPLQVIRILSAKWSDWPTLVSLDWRRPTITSKGWSRAIRKCKFCRPCWATSWLTRCILRGCRSDWLPACRPIPTSILVEASDRMHRTYQETNLDTTVHFSDGTAFSLRVVDCSHHNLLVESHNKTISITAVIQLALAGHPVTSVQIDGRTTSSSG